MLYQCHPYGPMVGQCHLWKPNIPTQLLGARLMYTKDEHTGAARKPAPCWLSSLHTWYTCCRKPFVVRMLSSSETRISKPTARRFSCMDSISAINSKLVSQTIYSYSQTTICVFISLILSGHIPGRFHNLSNHQFGHHRKIALSAKGSIYTNYHLVWGCLWKGFKVDTGKHPNMIGPLSQPGRSLPSHPNMNTSFGQSPGALRLWRCALLRKPPRGLGYRICQRRGLSQKRAGTPTTQWPWNGCVEEKPQLFQEQFVGQTIYSSKWCFTDGYPHMYISKYSWYLIIIWYCFHPAAFLIDKIVKLNIWPGKPNQHL